MASWTDEIVQFNPYIQTLPVEDMVKVGLLKQEQYNAGVQKVQAHIDSIANIDVIKDEHKEYLSKRMTQLETEINKVVGSDFSRNQLVSQIGGLTRQIQSDKIVQNAIVSTGRVRKAQAALEEAKASGKGYGVENEWLLNKQLGDWLNDQNAETTFSGSYTPYTDVKKKILDTIKAIDPSSTLTQVPFETDDLGNWKTDANGQPIINWAMAERSIKGKDPTTIRNAINAALDENDLRQIGITGAFHYRNATPQDMQKMLKGSTEQRGNDLVTKRDLLRIDAENAANAEDKAAYEEQLGLYEEELTKLAEDYLTSVKQLEANPDGFKQQLYTENMVRGFANAFSSSEVSNKYVKNPVWEGYVEDQKLKIAWEELAIKREEAAAKAEEDRNKANKADKTKPTDLSTAGNPYPVNTSEVFKPNEFSFEAETGKVVSQRDEIVSQALATMFPAGILEESAKKLGRDPALHKLQTFEHVIDKYRKGETINDNLVGAVKEVLKLNRDIDTRKATMENALAKANQQFPQFTNTNLAKQVQGREVEIVVPQNWVQGVTLGGTPTKVTLAPEDIVSLAMVSENTGWMGTMFNSKEKDDRLKSAQAAIRGKFPEKVANELLNMAKTGSMLPFKESLGQDIDTIEDQFLENPDFKKRQALIEQELNQSGRVGAPVGFDLKTGKPEDLRNVQDQAVSILQEAKKLGGGPSGTDEALEKLFTKEGVSFKVLWQPQAENNTEKFQLLVIDREGEDTPVPISKQRAEQLSGRVFDSRLNDIQTKLAHTGAHTTNPTGRPESAFLQDWDFPNTQKYRISADVTSSVTNPDEFFLKIHIPDKDTGQFVTKDVRMRNQKQGGLTLTQLQELIASLNDSHIDALLKPE